VIFRLPAFAGADRSAALGKKLYFRDNGIAGILAQPGEGALFENTIFNQLSHYGNLAYLMRGKDYKIDFVLTQPDYQPVGLEVKYHPLAVDQLRVQRIADRNGLDSSWLVGRHPTPGFEDFLWGGLIF
jgi:predicted AAA+ superfamily ATPase